MTRTSHKVLYRGIKSTQRSLVTFLKWTKGSEGEITLSLFQLQPTRTYLLIFLLILPDWLLRLHRA